MASASCCRPFQPPAVTRPVWSRRPDRAVLRRRARQRLCDLVMVTTAWAFAVPVGELTATSRRPPSVAFARQSAMYLAHITLGLSYSEIGRAFGRDRTTAAHACRLVEERRDDPAIDAMLASLESACSTLRAELDAAMPVEPAEPQPTHSQVRP